MNRSNELNELAVALSEAQGKMKPAKMNATNPFLKNKYADLGAVMDACRDVLSECGLSFVQMAFTPPSEEFGAAVGVETMLLHSSGQWLSERFVLPVGDEKGKSVMQVAGSAITYARRYALAAMLGIVADEDADGNAPPFRAAPKKDIDALDELGKKAYNGDWDTKKGQLAGYVSGQRTTNIAQLSADEVADLIKGVKTKLSQQESTQ